MAVNEQYSQYNAWLQFGQGIPYGNVNVTLHDGADQFAAKELESSIKRMYGKGAASRGADFNVHIKKDGSLPKEGYKLECTKNKAVISGADKNGMLYGVYSFLMGLYAGKDSSELSAESSPAFSARIINHWDNMSGSIERGYAGNSLFFKDGALSYDEKRIHDYARMLASVGINQISINNVNVTSRSAALITDAMLPEVSELAGIFRPFGIRLILSVHFNSPMILGGLKKADPLDTEVSDWWKGAAAKIYKYIPDLAGILIKADSEFQCGPASHGRTSADGANVIARALLPFGGTLYWRCFVYDCNQDWRDMKTDRPMAAYEHFYPLDGEFDTNVVLMVKNGPVDFQVREPNSPLIGAMEHTRQGIEFQITQEYTGQQIDLYALPVQWEEFFSFPVSDTRVTRDLAGAEVDAIAAVANVGDDENWTGHTLAQCNLYAFGRLAWDPRLTAEEIISDWTELTFGGEPRLLKPLKKMMMESRSVYEKYTAPLGIGWMVNVLNHYGPSVDGYEYSNWGAYHRADNRKLGIDRTGRGTGFTKQYHSYVASIFEDVETCPEKLLLFFHRLAYDFKLKSGKTLLQHIYDTHFEGTEDVERMIEVWKSLKPCLPEGAYSSVAARLERQLQNAREWRDVVNTYFLRKTGIPDEQGRKIYGWEEEI